MSEFQRFNYRTKEDLLARARELGDIEISFTEDVSILGQQVRIGSWMSPNSIAILPMEGCDSDADGRPSDLTRRRYLRFAEGGAGLLWWEACAVIGSGRANPRQMYIHDGSYEAIGKLLEEANESGFRRNGYKPLNVLQLTHSGRWSRPIDKPAPVITQHDPLLDQVVRIDESYPVISDDELERLSDHYVKGALLAKKAGFDGVDFKIAHRYLMSELLAAFIRKGKYGGSFENRTRYMLETYQKIRDAVGKNFIVGSRLGMYDCHPYPYGWGVDRNDMWKVDLTEPLKLVDLLRDAGMDLINVSFGNPYYRQPYVTRPYDNGTIGSDTPEENPLDGVNRAFQITAEAKKHLPDTPLVGSAYTWLKQFMFQAGAANKKAGKVDMVGMGRMALAYPDAAHDILVNGEINEKKVCMACSRCTQMMRDHGVDGCVIRDAALYKDIFNRQREEAQR